MDKGLATDTAYIYMMTTEKAAKRVAEKARTTSSCTSRGACCLWAGPVDEAAVCDNVNAEANDRGWA